MKKLRPLHDQILIRRSKAPEKSEGGIIRPANVEPKQYEGEVLAVGPGRVTDDGKLHPVTVQPGEYVLYAVFQGQTVPKSYDAEENLWLLQEKDLLAVVER